MANNQLLASDNFASGSLAAGWSAIHGQSASQIASHLAEPNALSTNAGQIWTGLTWPNDHASEVTVQTLTSETGNNIIILAVRMQSGADSGYQVNIQNINGVYNAQIFLYTNGSAVGGIGGVVVIPSISLGDTFTFQAAGSCLSLYQNGKQILYRYDATYTSGAPGFGEYTTVNVAHTQISSWRGYSAVQQDGIWQKQGIIIPANATDLTGSGEVGTQNPTIIGPEAGEILSGQVLKMWFAVPGAIGYAESPATDGQNWTRGSNVITATGMGIAPSVIKVGSTYHLYDGEGTIQHWTSASASTGWTQQSSNVFTKTSVVYFSPVAIISGTWYALYTIQSGTFPNTTGLATSSDGVTWADQGIVVNNFWGVTRAENVSGIYYAWGQTVNPNPQESTKPGIDPGEGLRMQTVDFIHWTNPVHSIHHSQIFEGVNEPDGGAYCSFPVNVNGKALLYYSAGPDDAIQTPASTLQIAVAVGPAPISSIVTATEDGLLPLASDAFQRADGSLGSNWATPAGGTALQIVSNLVEPTTIGSWNQAVRLGAFSNDQYSEITIHNAASGVVFLTATVRASLTALTFYEFYGLTLGSTANLGIGKWVNGTETLISPLCSTVVNVGDVFRISAIGNVVSIFQNNYLLLQVQDNSITTGNPGMNASVASGAPTQSQISLWAGGNANVIPSYPGGGSLLLCGVGK